jgi:pentatricopeptide repeat protein
MKNNVSHFIYTNAKKHELKHIIKKLTKKYNKTVNKYVEVMTNENTSKLTTYLLDIVNIDLNCDNCDNRCKIFLNYCATCYNYQMNHDGFKNNIENLLYLEYDKNKLQLEFYIFYQYCLMLLLSIKKDLFTYEKQLCTFSCINSFGVNFKNVYKYGKIVLNDEMTTNEKAQILLNEKCYELFNLPMKYIDCTYVDLSKDVKNYMDNYCKQKQLENMWNISKKLRDYMRHIMYGGTTEIIKFIKCKNVEISKEFKFCYKLINNKKYEQYVKQLKLHPMLCNSLISDCFLLLDIDGFVVRLYIEFDEYSYDTLAGGHSCLKRKLHDVVKDVYCLIFGFSLIRLKNTEDIFKLLDEMIERKCYPYYRFYDGYLGNKI